MKKGTEIYPGFDREGRWYLTVRKQRGRLTIDEIREAAEEYETDIYAMVVNAMDLELPETEGDSAILYRMTDFFESKEGTR